MKDNFELAASSAESKIAYYVLLEVFVHPNVKTFSYLGLDGKPYNQYVSNRQLKAYCITLNEALTIIKNNMHLVDSYKISCSRLIAGENYFL